MLLKYKFAITLRFLYFLSRCTFTAIQYLITIHLKLNCRKPRCHGEAIALPPTIPMLLLKCPLNVIEHYTRSDTPYLLQRSFQSANDELITFSTYKCHLVTTGKWRNLKSKKDVDVIFKVHTFLIQESNAVHQIAIPGKAVSRQYPANPSKFRDFSTPRM